MHCLAASEDRSRDVVRWERRDSSTGAPGSRLAKVYMYVMYIYIYIYMYFFEML